MIMIITRIRYNKWNYINKIHDILISFFFSLWNTKNKILVASSLQRANQNDIYLNIKLIDILLETNQMREGYQHCSTVGDGRCFDSEARWWQKAAVFYKVIVMAIIDRPFFLLFFYSKWNHFVPYVVPTISKISVYHVTASNYYFYLHKQRIITKFYLSRELGIELQFDVWQYLLKVSLFLCLGMWMEQTVDYHSYLTIHFVKF